MQLNMNLNTVQTVSPQIVASMTVLQCGAQELAAYLEELSYENPLIELQQPVKENYEQVVMDKLLWLKNNDRQNNAYYGAERTSRIEQFLPSERQECLTDYLLEQILLICADRTIRRAMETIIYLLDERGLYDGTVDEIAALCTCSLSTAKKALEEVRKLEPAGVAAGCVKDSLLTQLVGLQPRRYLAERIVKEHFEHLATWSTSRMAKVMQVSEEAVVNAKKVIASLNPYPAAGFASRENIQYVTPDVKIELDQTGVRVTVEERYIPSVRINSEYLLMLQSEKDPQTQEYLRQKLFQMEQLMSNLDSRKSTVARCSEIIAQRQMAFFQGGQIQKLTLRDVAEELGIHESTVSRAVRNKFVQCERGIYPMSVFFSRDVGQNVGMSRDQIKEVLEQIIAEENPEKPFSDERITEELAGRHITLSRRAVAKYRMELGIPPASARKRKDRASS